MLSSRECLDRQTEYAHQARLARSAKRRDVLFAMSRTWETLAKQTARLEAVPAEKLELADLARPAQS